MLVVKGWWGGVAHLIHTHQTFFFLTSRCLPAKEDMRDAKQAGFDFFYTNNHWSDFTSTKRYINRVVVPFLEKQRKKLDLPFDFPAVLILDCWSVHISKRFLEWMALNHPLIRLLFVPANCTGVMQPCDLAGQRELKCALRSIGTLYASVQVQEALKRLAALDLNEEEREERIAAGAIKIDTSTTALKPYIPDWHLAAWRQLQVKGAFRKGWDRSRLLEAYDEGKARLVLELAVEKNEKGSLWTGTKVVGGGEGEGGWSERIPAALEKKQVTKKTMNKETGEEEIEEMLVDLEEPEESETDIAERLGEVEREARFAEEVRCVGCCWMGTYNVVLYQAIDFSHTNKNTKHTDRAAAG